MRIIHLTLGVSGLIAVGCGGGTSGKNAAKSAPLDVATDVPADLLGEIEMRDPQGTVDRFGAEMGMQGSLWAKLTADVHDPDFARVLAAIDPHATLAAVAIGTFEDPHFMMGVHLRDPAAVAALVDRDLAAGKLHEVPAAPGAQLGSRVYVDKSTTLALVDDLLIIGDTKASLQTKGGYLAYRAMRMKLDHDVVGRVVLAPLMVQAQALAQKSWKKSLSSGEGSSGFDRAVRPVVARAIAALGDVGDLTFSMDLDAGRALTDVHLAAKGKLAQWLSAYPSAPAGALLGLPKGETMVVRFPQPLGKIFAAVLADDGAKSADDDAKDEIAAAIRTLGASLGNEVAFVYRDLPAAGAPPASGAPTAGKKSSAMDGLFRLELADAVAARGAVRRLITLTSDKEKKKTGKDTFHMAPYKKFGAEGELWSGKADDGDDTSLIWAQRGNYLYAEIAVQRSPLLLEAALEPSGKATLREDPKGKAIVERFPTDGLIFAYYGEQALKDVPAGSRWWWLAAEPTGLRSYMGASLAAYRPMFDKYLHGK